MEADTLPRTPLNPAGGLSPAFRRLQREGAEALRPPPVEADDAPVEDTDDAEPYMERDLRAAVRGLLGKWGRLQRDAEGKDPAKLAAAVVDDLNALQGRLPEYGATICGVNVGSVGEEVERQPVALFTTDGRCFRGLDVPAPPPRKPHCPRRCRAVTSQKYRCAMPTLKGRAFCSFHRRLNDALGVAPAP